MFGRCNVHVEALPQRLLAAPGRMFMHVPQIVRICARLYVRAFFPPESALSLEVC